ncbi:MAG: exodeoxyribonuclease V subunit beta [Gammaproteobacteria bacterium]|mgnify:CR=1 FL=1|nr:exodeoxyribonuclease V subunit beta [Gammaproteobacteria bacterium]
MTTPLDIRSFPLHGSRLIEASAGTGKTFTIALLYARLILQHGGEAAFVKALMPEDILVVTFTDAATQELKDRIRARLSDAARCFMNPQDDCDDVLRALRNDYDRTQWAHCARLLSLAAQSMDQAAVSTIHGWCYRMLREHAFDSGSLFQQTLITNQQDIFAELIRDYWRQHFYALPAATVQTIHREFTDPESLLQAVRPLINKTSTTLTFAGETLPDVDDLHQALAGFTEQAREVEDLQNLARQAWMAGRAELEDVLDSLQLALNKNAYAEAKQPAAFTELKQRLADWASGGEAPDRMVRFAQDQWKLSGGKKAPAQPHHPALLAIAEWLTAEQVIADSTGPDVRAIVLSHARRWLESALQKRLQDKAELGYDDLLLQLDRALQGPLGDKLAAQIRQDYPVAMIDEFQDTDPLQYRIFDRIYQLNSNRNDCALIMIGDPKQAIYSFRNADIHTYLAARLATTGRHYSLGTNYRSTTGVVEGINYLFRQAEAFAGGAFRFRQDAYNPLPFLSVQASGRREALFINDKPAPAITFWHLGCIDDADGDLHDLQDRLETIAITAYRRDMAKRCASEIAGWLHGDKTGFRSDAGFVRLRPRDIAILVRNRTEANAVRDALQAYDLASVYLSDRESVFACNEAHDVLRWLRACAEPADERKLRAALATPALDLSLARLALLNRDELAWEAETELFRRLHGLWQTQGVLPMLRHLMQFHQLPQRLINSSGGERRLTNLLHLAEYLQKASQQYEGEQALIRHLAEQMQNPGDEEVLRLESDSDLIRVVTIHKAKGLEYPLVCLPFAPDMKEVNHRIKQVTIVSPDHGDNRRLEIAGHKRDAEAWSQADHERLSEDMRLLYVALTRARHGLWLGAAALTAGNGSAAVNHKGALGYLMGGGEPLDAIGIADALQTWAEECEHIKLRAAPEVHDPSALAPDTAAVSATRIKPARVSTHSPAENWWIASYSALKTGRSADARLNTPVAPEPEAPQDDQAQEEHMTVREHGAEHGTQARRDFSRQAPGLHGFHRGPKPGTFLHSLLEWAEAQGFDKAEDDDESRRQMISQRCLQRGWQDDEARLDTWLKTFLSTRFALPDGRRLQLTQLHWRQAEMEFLFASHQVDAHKLDTLCQRHIQPDAERPALLPAQLNGMIKGFIDLVFEHQGQYYVADWKSNYLGPRDSHYTQPALQDEILHSRYDVQYAIYLLALHRLLRNRLPGYDYDKHVGGALYFFLRGHAAETQGLLADKPSLAFISELDTLFLTGQLTASTSRQEVLF